MVVLPGSGPASYDVATGTIWLPVVAHEEGFCSLVRCLGLHRFHSDRAERDSFARLDHPEPLSSGDAVAEEFARTYETYIMREAKGFRKLPQNLRKWFNTHMPKSP